MWEESSGGEEAVSSGGEGAEVWPTGWPDSDEKQSKRDRTLVRYIVCRAKGGKDENKV